MKIVLTLLSFLSLVTFAADAPATKPIQKITPGQVIIPFDKMQRPWGELISLDLAARTGKFRRESTDGSDPFILRCREVAIHPGADDLRLHTHRISDDGQPGRVVL